MHLGSIPKQNPDNGMTEKYWITASVSEFKDYYMDGYFPSIENG